MKIVQYVFLRNDLKKFSKGALVAQACHSCVKAIEKFKNNVDTINYLKQIDDMHKVVLKIKQQDISDICEYFENNKIDYVTWVEQPENMITALSTRPYTEDTLHEHIEFIKKYKLF
ncbi:putative peptidyl-tRNA hydrolase PTRHD1 [Nosema granulosis]|uniref:peptidyl-tRNA hydrolase n=1 Tax=Nosema granulosis TaxID=83296 RepID=A0A9P6H2Q4_9MICR|nr:putative peptidyl-tRNA hydrolase PTRHD1 [Nosema granulosis]